MKKLFSILAVFSVFAACKPTPVPVQPQVEDAVAEVVLTVVDVVTGAQTDEYQILPIEGSTIIDNVITFKGNPTLESKLIEVQIKFTGYGPGNGKVYRTEVNVPELSAGGYASVPALMIVNQPLIDVEEPAIVTIPVTAFDVLAQRVTNSVEIRTEGTVAGVSVDGSVITITGNKEIAPGVLKVIAKFTGEGQGKNKEYATSVRIDRIYPGQQYTWPISINVNDPALNPNNKAKAVIRLSTIDVQTGVAATGVTYSTTFAGAVVRANTVTIEGNPTIAAANVEITAKYNGVNYKKSIAIDNIPAGMSVNYDLMIAVNEPRNLSDYEFSLVAAAAPVISTEVAYLNEAIDHGTTLVGIDGSDHQFWARNESESFLKVSLDYTEYSGTKVTDVKLADPEFENVVSIYVSAINTGIVTTPKVFNFTVSAYAWYTAWQTRYTGDYQYFVVASIAGSDPMPVALIKATSIASTSVEYTEVAPPPGAVGHGHYSYGAGHGSGNAGGGIIFAD